ncbi:GAF domain-containing protein [Vallitalea okinawensis]|uniref:GAF domain-containing protein n=1 Tax=Vallitalea okinawensis TaxID=2078660 RepID=UPI000CFB3A14|nr:GAF domain-containing protein [Vallitalea okinawensis]
MFDHTSIDSDNKKQFYEQLILRIKGIMEGERDTIANLANVASVLYNQLEEINWAGFYLHKEDQLILGPFQGKSACIRIPLGRGVCGTAAKDKVTMLVKDVHEFPGHIACDAASRSEIVVPMVKEGVLLGILDIDSPVVQRFDERDQKYMEEIADILVKGCNW